MNKIFYDTDKIWKGFEAPEKPKLDQLKIVSYWGELDNYHKAYAAARAAALNIINPEILKQHKYNGVDYFNLNGRHVLLTKSNDYDWPGDMYFRPSMSHEFLIPEGIVLYLPAKETGKKAEEIIEKHFPGFKLEFISKEAKTEMGNRLKPIMHDFSDQQLASFKEKLKEELKRKILETEGWQYNFERGINEAIKIIDQL